VAVWRWWLARREIRRVRGIGPPLVQSRVLPPGRPWGEPRASDGQRGVGWRAARCVHACWWQWRAARVSDSNAGSRSAGQCPWSASAELAVAADRLWRKNRANFMQMRMRRAAAERPSVRR
jgi:hypothetical protein